MNERLELGVDTFGDVTADEHGQRLSHAEVIRNVVEEGVLADRVGLSFFGVGEHHRDDFSVSAPEVVLAAIAARTEQIHLGSAVTVLSSDDPIRVFQRFSTLDAISSGRAEVILGRGSFTESFPLFGFDLADYERLFTDKLDLFAAIRAGEPVTWSGSTRAPLSDVRVFPPVEHGQLKAWIGVGGSPESVIRAAGYGMPLMLAVIGGEPARFAPFADLYRRALDQLGRDPLPIGMHSPGLVADSDEEARDLLWPHYRAMVDRIGRERGWGPITRDRYEIEADASGALFVGSPETVAHKIVAAADALGLSRFDLKVSNGTLPHPVVMRSIELYGARVAPLVHELRTRSSLREDEPADA